MQSENTISRAYFIIRDKKYIFGSLDYCYKYDVFVMNLLVFLAFVICSSLLPLYGQSFNEQTVFRGMDWRLSELGYNRFPASSVEAMAGKSDQTGDNFRPESGELIDRYPTEEEDKEHEKFMAGIRGLGPISLGLSGALTLRYLAIYADYGLTGYQFMAGIPLIMSGDGFFGLAVGYSEQNFSDASLGESDQTSFESYLLFVNYLGVDVRVGYSSAVDKRISPLRFSIGYYINF